ncbi:Steroid nuclear receptor ligand-binding [Quillaja saponaria]|uniref:Steroid nuclear receptor ligand-binding n=1 Tax=Quillaja saponaria TaxID=32244 RepID=A0AAD7LX14_QUISA|nr:Steroid nuclear receptor ligand-binding [Quillaja saponaria]
MEVPVGFVAKLWSFITFLPFFLLLFVLGILKGAAIVPFATGITVIGNSSVLIGLWPAHFIWTIYCVARTKRLGLVLKIVVLISLPVPLLLWPLFGIVGRNVTDKCYHCFVDGCWSTIERCCIVVQDFTDFCFHSYFSFMDELSENVSPGEKPLDIKLSILPSCLLVILIGVPFDMLLITSVAIWKSPYMLFQGWKRLLQDLIGREGPFLETVCVPFAGLAIILWPMAVIGAVVAAIISSFFLGLYSGVIVHKEDSILMGFAYVVSVVSLFDEYVNDLLYLREGSCLPRPKYCRNMIQSHEKKDLKNETEGSLNPKLISERSRTLKWKLHRYRPVQVWDWLFKSCEVNSRILLRDGLISVKDIEECIVKGNCKKLSVELPAWSLLQCLLTSAKSDSAGLVISDDEELTWMDGPRDEVLEWFIGPLLIMKEQLKKLKLDEMEEICLINLVMRCNNDKPQDWDNSGFPSSDNVMRAQLQAIIRRLLGIVASMSRIPTFRRRFRNMVKVLYIEALQTSASACHIGGIIKPRFGDKRKMQNAGRTNGDEPVSKEEQRAYDNGNVV